MTRRVDEPLPAELVQLVPLLQRPQSSDEAGALAALGMRRLPFLATVWPSGTRLFRRNAIDYVLVTGTSLYRPHTPSVTILRLRRGMISLVCGPRTASDIRSGAPPGSASDSRVIDLAPPGVAAVEARFVDGTAKTARVRDGIWTARHTGDSAIPIEIRYR